MTDLAHALRILSTLACGVVLIAFVMFAADQRQDPAAQVAATQAAVAAPEPEHGGVRGVIEDVNDTLVAPFEGVATSEDPWVVAAVPALLALLAYGLLARLLIAYLPARR